MRANEKEIHVKLYVLADDTGKFYGNKFYRTKKEAINAECDLRCLPEGRKYHPRNRDRLQIFQLGCYVIVKKEA